MWHERGCRDLAIEINQRCLNLTAQCTLRPIAAMVDSRHWRWPSAIELLSDRRLEGLHRAEKKRRKPKLSRRMAQMSRHAPE
jgi:hypothetical protein